MKRKNPKPEPADSDGCARYLKVVADPDRLAIIERLQRGPEHVSAIAKALKKNIANVSHHLKILREAGLVSTSKQGKYITYSLTSTFFPAAAQPGAACCLDLGCCQLNLRPEP
ncbi:MAG: metalloregulator ArsR/SmtB family transcription factor [Gemmataceae bacterium]